MVILILDVKQATVSFIHKSKMMGTGERMEAQKNYAALEKVGAHTQKEVTI